MKSRRIYFIFIAVVCVIFTAFAINMCINDREKKDSIEAAWSIAEAYTSMPARYAYLTLKSIKLQQSDCYVCSAEGNAPIKNIQEGSEIAEGYVTPFSDFEMIAYIISGSPIKEDTIPISMIIFKGFEETEEISIEAKISPITENLYTAEFLLPRDKLSTDMVRFMNMKCGIGNKYTYSIIVDARCINLHILLNDTILNPEEH